MRHLDPLQYRIGRRGAALLFFALLDLIYAYSLLGASATSSTYRFLTTVLPLPIWAALWAGVGLLCLTQAFMLTDRVAFAAASLIKVVWGVMQLIGWLYADLDRGYMAAVVWLAFAGFVHVIAGWAEPTRLGR